MIPTMPKIFQKENDAFFIAVAAEHAPIECTLAFYRTHRKELSDECLERLVKVFDEKAKMPDAEIYPYAKPGSFEEENNRRVMEDHENYLFMANGLRDDLQKRKEAKQNAESDSH